jgi:8-oxo-dGTP pyrophosphatase MutT (NUDIX family)
MSKKIFILGLGVFFSFNFISYGASNSGAGDVDGWETVPMRSKSKSSQRAPSEHFKIEGQDFYASEVTVERELNEDSRVLVCIHNGENILIAQKAERGYWFTKGSSLYKDGFPLFKAGEKVLPGGGSKHGERLIRAAIRELLEETGINLDPPEGALGRNEIKLVLSSTPKAKKFTTGVEEFYALYLDVSTEHLKELVTFFDEIIIPKRDKLREEIKSGKKPHSHEFPLGDDELEGLYSDRIEGFNSKVAWVKAVVRRCSDIYSAQLGFRMGS